MTRTLFCLAVLLTTPLARAQDEWPGNGGERVSVPPPPEPPAKPALPEPPEPRFGKAGETMLGGDTSSSLVSSRWSSSQARDTSFAAAIDLRHFVVDDLAIGVYLSASASENRGYGSDSTLVQLRRERVSGAVVVGYNVPLGVGVSFFPTVLFGVHRTHQSISVPSGGSASIAASPSGAEDVEHSGSWFQIALPLYLHPTPHFFIGLGPSWYRDFAAELSDAGVSGRRSWVGIDVRVGGWWGGPHVESEEWVKTRTRHFGEAGTFAITNEHSLGAGYSWYSGTDGWDGAVSIRPGFDYFIADHFSLGASGELTYTETVGFDDSRRILTKTTAIGVGPRAGADLPVTDWLSLYLRAGFLFGSRSYSESGRGGVNAATNHVTRAYVSLHAMLHAASHLFVGVGPTFGSDLESTDQHSRSNRQTAIGMSALVGGWL